MIRPSVAVLALALALTACGGQKEAKMPPLTPEPGDAQSVIRSNADPAQSLAARRVLYRFLRGVAAGDTKVCADLTPAYERVAFGEAGGCRSGLAAARARLRPKDLTALRTVSVPTGEPGPDASGFVVRFEDLKWQDEPARPGGILAASFTLSKTGNRWLITA